MVHIVHVHVSIHVKNVENCKSKWGWQYLSRSTEAKILLYGYLQVFYKCMLYGYLQIRCICVYPTCRNPSCYLKIKMYVYTILYVASCL